MAAQGAAAIYSIGAVAKMLGISAQTLRAWEDRYKQIVPCPKRRAASGSTAVMTSSNCGSSGNRSRRVCSRPTPIDCWPSALASRADERRADEPGAGRSDKADSRISILLAERDPYAAEFADYFLRTEGYRRAVVLDADARRQVLDDDPPDVLSST